MNLLATSDSKMMSSIDLLSLINSSRDSLGERQVRHNDFIARAIDELEGEHYETFVVQNMNKTETKALMLNQDQCMLVAMRESKMVRRSVLEKLKQINNPQLPQTFAEALQLAANQAKLLEEAAPKVEFHDKIVNDAATFSLRDAAKKIQQRPNKFSAWLRSEGYLCQNNLPKQQYINQGLFKTHTGQSRDEYQFSQTRVTSKGLAYFTKKLGDNNL